MGKIIMWNLMTLDGYFEGTKKWDLDFHDIVWGEELEQLSIEQLKSLDMLLFGRTTYEGMASYWSTATGQIADFMNNLPKMVFSKTLETAGWNNTKLVKEDAVQVVTQLRQQSGNDIFIFGSAKLSSALTEHGLFDEYRICVAPLLLGSGNLLFKPGSNRMKMTLLEARTLKTGGVILRYQPEKVKAK